MIFLFGVLLFLSLIIPPADAGGIVKIVFFMGLSFFVLNYPWPVGADEINIPRCRRRVIRASFYPSSVSFADTFSCAHPSVRTGAPSRGRFFIPSRGSLAILPSLGKLLHPWEKANRRFYCALHSGAKSGIIPTEINTNEEVL